MPANVEREGILVPFFYDFYLNAWNAVTDFEWCDGLFCASLLKGTFKLKVDGCSSSPLVFYSLTADSGG